MTMKFNPIVMGRTDPHHVRHETIADAEKEAERLARLTPGKDYCIYIPVKIICVPELPIRRTPVTGGSEDDIPF